jgi:hypothetical protein
MVNPNLKHMVSVILNKDFHVQGTYDILPDGSVNVDGNVTHINKQKMLRVRFNHVTGSFTSRWKGLTDLTGLPTQVGKSITVTYYPTMGGLLRLLVAPQVNLQSTTYKQDAFEIDQKRQKVNAILDAYAGQGKPGAIKAATELIKAGYPEHAKW